MSVCSLIYKCYANPSPTLAGTQLRPPPTHWTYPNWSQLNDLTAHIANCPHSQLPT